MLEHEDTIAAIATPPGRGGIGVVRISGPLTRQIARHMLGLDAEPEARHASLHNFYTTDGTVIDQGIALYFQSPASYTGEDILELQGHGGPVVMDMLLQTALTHGARLARPGEFSERAFINGRIDLIQAEAIADLIDSHSQQAARSALQSLQGRFSRQIEALVQELIDLRSYVEAAIDFVDEEIDFLSAGQVRQRLATLQTTIAEVLARAQQGVLLRDGMNIVIAGPPNAGKSSLLNVLAGTDTAIVTEQAGTTRDVLREHIVLDGLPLHIIDTAGLRDSEEAVEQIGINRARDQIRKADLVLLVFDANSHDAALYEEMRSAVPDDVDVVIVWNKIDLSGDKPRRSSGLLTEVFVSVTGGQGMDLLIEQLKECAGYHPGSENAIIARRRHLTALEQAAGYLDHGSKHLQGEQAGELLAEDLRQAQQALSQITGIFTSDDLLASIFSSFCIGK